MPAFRLRWVGICLASFLFQACSPEAVLPNVSLEQAQSEPEAGKVLMIDVREPLVHATGVRNPGQADQPVLLICKTQNRSRAVTEALKEQGFTNVRYVNGGMSEWAKRGWPMVKPQELVVPAKS